MTEPGNGGRTQHRPAKKPLPPAPNVQHGQRVRIADGVGVVDTVKYSPATGWWISVRIEGREYRTRNVEVIR